MDVGGDFKNLLSSNNKIGAPFTQAEIHRFKDMTEASQLTLLKSTGCHFTWCNKHEEKTKEYIARLIRHLAIICGYCSIDILRLSI